MNPDLCAIEEWEELAEAANYFPGKLAELCGVSSRQLERFFHERIEEPPRQWLHRVRLERSLVLLQLGERIKQVSLILHFWDTAHFSREFKRAYGCSPREYQARPRPVPLLSHSYKRLSHSYKQFDFTQERSGAVMALGNNAERFGSTRADMQRHPEL